MPGCGQPASTGAVADAALGSWAATCRQLRSSFFARQQLHDRRRLLTRPARLRGSCRREEDAAGGKVQLQTICSVNSGGA